MAGEERKDRRSPPKVLALYYRRLPHLQPEGRVLFVIWALAGVVPVCKETIAWTSDGAVFARRDRQMDRAEFGPTWLAQEDVGCIVKDVLIDRAQRGNHQLGAWVVLPNYVHILIEPCCPLASIMRETKSSSARLANKVLEREGRFWQREYYDRVVRNDLELARICRYIGNNPVRAGLCWSPECWKWGSAHSKFQITGHGPALHRLL